MTIDPDASAFPNNAVEIIAARTETLDDELTQCVFRRSLRKTDPVLAVGVYAAYWNPDEDSYEMLGGPIGYHMPTLSRYTIGIEAYVKDQDEVRGLKKHAVLSTMIRAMLYRDTPLRVGLRALSVNISGSTERVQRTGIRTQRFASNELQGSYLYLSTIEFWLETEMA